MIKQTWSWVAPSDYNLCVCLLCACLRSLHLKEILHNMHILFSYLYKIFSYQFTANFLLLTCLTIQHSVWLLQSEHRDNQFLRVFSLVLKFSSPFFFLFFCLNLGLGSPLSTRTHSDKFIKWGIPGYVAARACFSVLFFVGARGEPGNEASRAVQ